MLSSVRNLLAILLVALTHCSLFIFFFKSLLDAHCRETACCPLSLSEARDPMYHYLTDFFDKTAALREPCFRMSRSSKPGLTLETGP